MEVFDIRIIDDVTSMIVDYFMNMCYSFSDKIHIFEPKVFLLAVT